MSRFNEAFEVVLGHEGGFQKIYNDRGNWTGGQVGVGVLKGTKYGITAMSYPKLDIENLTLDQARKIYKENYWDAIEGDSLPPALALVAFDTAINSGVGRAKEFLAKTNKVSEFLDIRRKFIRSLRLYPVIANTQRKVTWGQVWENRINSLEATASQWEILYPSVRPQNPQETPSDTFVVYNRGAGEIFISERFEDENVIINPMGKKVYVTLK